MDAGDEAALAPGELRGLRVLVTRPREQAEHSCAQIEAAGGQAIFAPCLHEAPPQDAAALTTALATLGRFTWVALASQSGARAFVAGLQAQGQDPRRLPLQVAAVGARTAAVLEQAGVQVALLAEAAQRTGAGLAGQLAALGGGGAVLLPRAEEGREELAEGLRAAGLEVVTVTAYRMVATPVAELAARCAPLRQLPPEGVQDLVPLTSPRTVALLREALGPEAAPVLARAHVGAIGTTTAEALRGAGIAVALVARGDFNGLLRALARHARGAQPS